MAQYLSIDSASGKVYEGFLNSDDTSILHPDGSQGDMIVSAEGFEPGDMWDGSKWIPELDTRTYKEKRSDEYPALEEQFDMMYHDIVTGTTVWQDTIKSIKDKYAKT